MKKQMQRRVSHHVGYASRTFGCTSWTFGFTLIELLVVISIIALLIALLLPTLDRARAEAQAIACASQQKQFGVAFRIYGDENEDALPQFAHNFPAGGGSSSWHIVTAEYIGENLSLKDSDAHLCPTGEAGVGVHYGAFNNRTINNVPAPPPAPILYASQGTTVYPIFKYSQVNYPSTWMLLLDTASPYHFMYTYNNWVPGVDTDGDGLDDTHPGVAVWIFVGMQFNGARPRVHRDSSNITLVDGHVERIEYQTFMDVTANFWRDDI